MIDRTGGHAHWPVSHFESGTLPAGAPRKPDAEPVSRRHHVLTTIGSGSLASAYSVMRAQEAGTSARSSGDGPIMSAVGIPGAFDAYAEILAMAAA